MGAGIGNLDLVFRALSDATRRDILMQVRAGDKTVNDIAARFNMSLPAVSKHLKALERSGLITRRRQGRKRICRAKPESLNAAVEWLDHYQTFWASRLDELKQLLEKES